MPQEIYDFIYAYETKISNAIYEIIYLYIGQVHIYFSKLNLNTILIILPIIELKNITYTV